MNAKYSRRWFKRATVEQLKEERIKFQEKYRSSELSGEEKSKLKRFLHTFDVEITEKERAIY